MKKIEEYIKDLLQDFDSKTSELDNIVKVPEDIKSNEEFIKWMLSE